MDKYTVDLDKVLNDFEYSELTEHNNDFTPTTVQFAQTSSETPTMPYLQQPYTKIQVSTPKHSINNVFHSLNEYLNSDIKTDLIPESSTSLNNIQEIEANIPQLPTRNERNSSIEEIFASISTKEEIPPPSPEQTKSEEFHEKNNNFNQTDLVEPIDIDDSATENHVDVKEIDKNENSPEEECLEIVEEIIKFEPPKTNEEHESTDTDSDVEEPNFETPQIPNNQQESEVAITVENGPNELKITPKAPISFADIKISDTDIENELADLEEQFEADADIESPQKKRCLKLELEESKTETIELVTVINDVQKTEDINSKLHENSDSDDVESESELNSESPDLDSLKQNGNTVPEIVNDDIEIESNQENPIEIAPQINLEPPPHAVEPDTTTPEINENSAQVQELDVIVEKPQDVEFSEEIVEKTIEISSPTVTEIKIEDAGDENIATRRNSSLIRPNSLDLNSDQDNLTITLIGDPGSTPYNNMYVENSLKPQTADQDDINNSLSPTLSETSPYENSDSPNTSDSCNDTSFEDYSNNLPAKNTNKDAETRLNNPEMGQGMRI